VRDLAPGVHAFWKIGRSVAIEIVDLRVQALEIREQLAPLGIEVRDLGFDELAAVKL
jgi:hypothetical protein